MSDAQKRAYHARSTGVEQSASAELKRELESLQASVLPPELVDSTDPEHAAWVGELMGQSSKFQCLQPMPETKPREGDPTLTIEECYSSNKFRSPDQPVLLNGVPTDLQIRTF